MQKIKYTWQDIVMEVNFDYESQYEPIITENFITIYKTTFFKDGTANRKGNYWNWPSEKYWDLLVIYINLMRFKD